MHSVELQGGRVGGDGDGAKYANALSIVLPTPFLPATTVITKVDDDGDDADDDDKANYDDIGEHIMFPNIIIIIFQ